MKTLIPLVFVSAATLVADATTFHRSFRNGYPSGSQGVTVRQQPNAAVLKAPKTSPRPKMVVVTNRVVITKEQAEKLLNDKKRYKK